MRESGAGCPRPEDADIRTANQRTLLSASSFREGHEFYSCRCGSYATQALAAEGSSSSLNPGYAEQYRYSFEQSTRSEREGHEFYSCEPGDAPTTVEGGR